MWDLCVNVNPEALIQPRQWEKTENGQNLQNLRCRSAHCLQPVIPVPLYEGGGGETLGGSERCSEGPDVLVYRDPLKPVRCTTVEAYGTRFYTPDSPPPP